LRLKITVISSFQILLFFYIKKTSLLIEMCKRLIQKLPITHRQFLLYPYTPPYPRRFRRMRTRQVSWLMAKFAATPSHAFTLHSGLCSNLPFTVAGPRLIFNNLTYYVLYIIHLVPNHILFSTLL